VADEATADEEARRAVARAAPGRDPDVALLLVWLARLSRLTDATFTRIASRHGLLQSETAVLLTLWWSGPPHRLRPTLLADNLAQTSGGMTATLRRLEEAGFVSRVADPADGRVSLAALTPRGERAALAAFGDMVEHFEDVLGDIGPDGRAQVVTALRRLLDAVEAGEGASDSGRLARRTG
jgi:DNA-binding MarR family transcriptional regulator